MEKIKWTLGVIALLLMSFIVHSQTSTKEDPSVTFQKRFDEMFTLINTDSSSIEAGKKTGLLDATPKLSTEYSAEYKANPKKKMPFATREEYKYSISDKKWSYNASFGNYTPAQATQQKEMEDKLLKLIQEYMAKTNWTLADNIKENDRTKYLLNYRNSKTRQFLSVRVEKRSTENVISIQVR